MAQPQAVMCPSSTCEDGALLLGRVTERGVVAFAARPVRLDEQAAAELRSAGDPERAFRFSTPCARSGCAQWSGRRCGVIEAILEAQPPGAAAPHAPACLIRDRCRWRLQRGPDACAICRHVVTNSEESETHPAL